MNLKDLYVEEDLRRLRGASLTPGERHTIDWLTHAAGDRARHRPSSVAANSTTRAVLRWLGSRLVHVGERLQAWSAAGRPEPQAR